MTLYHFIGIGGIGMGKLASLLLSKGVSVSGSDVRENAMVMSLRQQGADIVIGHDAGNIKEADHVVYSSAVSHDNPELIAAKKKGCQVLKRAQLLAALMKDYDTITVAGAHGKTTTTSMIAHVFMKAGLDPTVALGGVFQQGSYEETLGHGKYFVAELDESDGSFLYFHPDISIITNIDFEHVDYYQNWDNILNAYQTFITQTSKDGVVIFCGEDERLNQLMNRVGKRYISYGLEAGADLNANNFNLKNDQVIFDCYKRGQFLGPVVLHVIGKHNVLNALAAIAAGLEVGLSFNEIVAAIDSYRGVKRRFEFKGRWGDIVLYDDYAHHPTEIQQTLKAARSMGFKRVVAVFQPHRYSRIGFLWEDFSKSFTNADKVIMTDIYAASEKNNEHLEAAKLCVDISRASGVDAAYVLKESIVDEVARIVESGDLILTLGAGDITEISTKIAQHFQERC